MDGCTRQDPAYRPATEKARFGGPSLFIERLHTGRSVYRLFVIPGSHACRSAMLMLEHKGLPYRRTDIVPLMHPAVARLHGFDAGGQTRSAGGKRTLGIRLGDRLGTVPALAANGHKVSTNHGIARFLDVHHPDPRLFPADSAEREKVEDAERWANDALQMAARRILGGAVLRD